jgi:hypothetical protein
LEVNKRATTSTHHRHHPVKVLEIMECKTTRKTYLIYFEKASEKKNRM